VIHDGTKEVPLADYLLANPRMLGEAVSSKGGTAVTGGVKGGLPFLLKVPLPAAPSQPARPPTRLTTRGPPGRCCR
jgi:hypothetical protein